MMEYMGAPDDKELELIKKLRENVQDLDLCKCEEVLGNTNLIRWIRARNHNVKDAEQMFRNYIEWFDGHKLDTILMYEAPKEVSDATGQPICGFDRWGCPIVLFAFVQIDYAKLMREGHGHDIFMQHIQHFERDAYFVRRLMVEQRKTDSIILFSAIVDVEGLSWRQFASTDVIQLLLKMARTFEANYPETLHKIIVINAPAVFTLFFSIVKPFLSQRTLEKIQVYGHNRQQWQEAVYKLASEECLPERYGGILPDDIDILPERHDCKPKKRGSY